MSRTWSYISDTSSSKLSDLFDVQTSKSGLWSVPSRESGASRSSLSGATIFTLQSILNAPTKKEEVGIVKKEIDDMKHALSTANQIPISTKFLSETLAKAIFLHITGHEVSFINVHVMQLAQSPHMHLKKLGYIACSVLFENKSECNQLLLNTVIHDLSNSDNTMAMNIALTYMANNISSISDRSDLIELLLRKATHKQPFIRRKSLNCIHALMVYHQNHEKGCGKQDWTELTSVIESRLCDSNASVIYAALQCLKTLIGNVQSTSINVVQLISGLLELHRQISVRDELKDETYSFKNHKYAWHQLLILDILSILIIRYLNESRMKIEKKEINFVKCEDFVIKSTQELCRKALNNDLHQSIPPLVNLISLRCVEIVISMMFYFNYSNSTFDLVALSGMTIRRFLTSDHINFRYAALQSIKRVIEKIDNDTSSQILQFIHLSDSQRFECYIQEMVECEGENKFVRGLALSILATDCVCAMINNKNLEHLCQSILKDEDDTFKHDQIMSMLKRLIVDERNVKSWIEMTKQLTSRYPKNESNEMEMYVKSVLECNPHALQIWTESHNNSGNVSLTRMETRISIWSITESTNNYTIKLKEMTSIMKEWSECEIDVLKFCLKHILKVVFESFDTHNSSQCTLEEEEKLLLEMVKRSKWMDNVQLTTICREICFVLKVKEMKLERERPAKNGENEFKNCQISSNNTTEQMLNRVSWYELNDNDGNVPTSKTLYDKSKSLI